MICWTVSTQYRCVTDRRTDGRQTSFDSIVRAMDIASRSKNRTVCADVVFASLQWAQILLICRTLYAGRGWLCNTTDIPRTGFTSLPLRDYEKIALVCLRKIGIDSSWKMQTQFIFIYNSYIGDSQQSRSIIVAIHLYVSSTAAAAGRSFCLESNMKQCREGFTARHVIHGLGCEGRSR